MDVCGFARPGLLNFLTRVHAECANVTLAHLLQHGLSFRQKPLNGLVQAAGQPFFDHQRSRLGPFARLAAVRLELLTMNRLLRCSPEFSTNLILKYSNRRRTRTRDRGQSGGTRMLAHSRKRHSGRSSFIIERQQSPLCRPSPLENAARWTNGRSGEAAARQRLGGWKAALGRLSSFAP